MKVCDFKKYKEGVAVISSNAYKWRLSIKQRALMNLLTLSTRVSITDPPKSNKIGIWFDFFNFTVTF